MQWVNSGYKETQEAFNSQPHTGCIIGLLDKGSLCLSVCLSTRHAAWGILSGHRAFQRQEKEAERKTTMVGNKHQRLLKVEYNKVTQLVEWASSFNQIRSVSFYKKDKIELCQILPQRFGQLNCLFHFLIKYELENVSLVSFSSHHTPRRLTKVKMRCFYTLMTVIL